MSDPPSGAESFRSVDDRGAAAFEVRGSEFIGYVASAADLDAAESFVETVRSEHPDATHHVPAYRVPADRGNTGTPASAGGSEGGMLREYHSDDGEPTGSAGKPALNVFV